MNTVKRKIILVICLINILSSSHAQQLIDCHFNISKALNYFEGDEYHEVNHQKAARYLTPCLTAKHPHAQIVMATILLEEEQTSSDKKAFKLLKSAANAEDHIAMNDLADLYKYGIGCKLSFNKARKWYLKAYEHGNKEAAYGLGYLHLKGMGSSQQNYKKAIYWFRKSNHPMARYWLGVCYYYGYGVPKNRTIANEYFSTELDYQNPQKPASDRIEQQELLLQQFKQQQSIQTIQEKIIEDQQLLGNWEGSLFVMDWSDNQIEQELPIKINFTKNEDLLQSIWEINNNSHQNDFTRIDNTLFYDDFFASIAHTSFKKEIPSTLVHQITETTFSIQKKDAQTYLTANIKSNINQWNEKGAPIRLLLTKKSTEEKQIKQKSLPTTPLIVEQTEDVSHFIVYPNPFPIEKGIKITYLLNRPQKTSISIQPHLPIGSEIKTSGEVIIKPVSIQNQGKYTYTFTKENFEEYGLAGKRTQQFYEVILTADNKKYRTRIMKRP